jgi:MFS transporter, FSR family, fosmidomycin resistance protein
LSPSQRPRNGYDLRMAITASLGEAAQPRPLREDAPTIGLVGLAHGTSHFFQLALPPLFPWIGAAMALSHTELGVLLTVFYVVSWAGQALAGFVVDRFGARRVLFGGVACIGGAALGLALSPNYPMLLVFMALGGAGNCVFHPVDFSIMNQRVSTARLGNAYAVHGIAGNLGWTLAPVFVVGLTQASGSWRVAMAATAVLIGAVLVALLLGRQSLGAVQARPQRLHDDPLGSLGFLRLPAVWYCFAFFLVFAFALGGIQSFAPAAAGVLHGVAATQVAICLSSYMAASAVGMVLGGQLVRDPARSARIAAIGFGFAAVLALTIGLGSWPGWAVPLLFAAMGLGAGLAGPARDMLVKQATPEGATGRVYGVVYSGLDVGMALSALAFGTMMDGGHYRAVWLVVALAQACLVVTAFSVKRRWRTGLLAAAG